MKFNVNYYEGTGSDVERYLHAKGITDIESYARPTADALIDYTKLDNIIEGAKTLIKYLEQPKSRIFILPDTDQDGFSSAAILFNYIKKVKPEQDIVFKVHNGKVHGIIDEMITEDIDLFLIPDAGTDQFEQHKKIAAMGKEVIVIDHHLPENDCNCAESPAIIINNQLSADYPNKTLCGAAVCLKFCMALDDLLGVDYAEEFYDLAAVALVADMMDLRDMETRYIVEHGLSHIRNFGLMALIDKNAFFIKDVTEPTPTEIAFNIAPMVNALIRVGTEKENETLFMAFIAGDAETQSTKRGAKEGDLETFAIQNARNCTNARSRQNRLRDKAIDYFECYINKYNLYDDKILFLDAGEIDLKPSLTGLVANHFSNKYQRPVIVARLDDSEGFYKGSGRGYNKGNFQDFRGFLIDSSLVDYARGHANSFGVSVPVGKMNSLINFANDELADVDFCEGTVDFCYDDSNPNYKNSILETASFAPLWGQGLPEPIYGFTNFIVANADFQVIGSNQDTLKFTKNGVTFIKFKAQDTIDELIGKDCVKLTFTGRANINEWGGRATPQIIIDECEVEDYNYEF